MGEVWRTELPSHLKLVLLAVADHANDDGWAYPGQASLAVKCSLSERQVRGSLKQLEELGLLEVVRRGRNITNLYRVFPSSTGGDNPVGRQNGDRQSTSAPERQPAAGGSGSPLPPNHQRTVSRTISAAGRRWAQVWAEMRQVPATPTALAVWGGQVDAFMAAGGEPTRELLARAVARGIEQPAGWVFAVEGARPPWPSWVPAYLVKVCERPDGPVDSRWEREYSFGPHSPVPNDKAAVIRAKERLLARVAGGEHVDEAVVWATLLEVVEE